MGNVVFGTAGPYLDTAIRQINSMTSNIQRFGNFARAVAKKYALYAPGYVENLAHETNALSVNY